MTLWDGLETDDQDASSNRILIIGATNRAQDLDAAILRRMPTRYHVPLPNAAQRVKIFELVLANEVLDVDVNLEELANKTATHTGSDINEICRQAAMQRIVELCNQRSTAENASDEDQADAVAQLRSIRQDDFRIALEKVRNSHQHQHSFT